MMAKEATEGTVLAVYGRPFSESPGFQAACSVQYRLRRYGHDLVVEIQRCSRAPRLVRRMLRNADEAYGAALLQFLYENALQPEAAVDILEDCCGTAIAD